MIASVLLLAHLPSMGGADSTVIVADLPTPRAFISAEWDGQNAYIFGGGAEGPESQLREIVRFNPSTGAVTLMGAQLPTERENMASASTGEHVFIFGGILPGRREGTDEILKYTPATDTLTVLSTKLPKPRWNAVAVWTGEYIFFAGGRGPGPDNLTTESPQIYRFNPSDSTLVEMNGRLPQGLTGMGAVWTGDRIYFFGGGNSDGLSAAIISYDPATDTTRTELGFLPNPIANVAAVWDGGYAYLLGGNQGLDTKKYIVRYRPGDVGVAGWMASELPARLYGHSAIWDGERAFVFGGASTFGPEDVRSWVTRYTLEPAAPGLEGAASGPLPGEITLTWTAPSGNSYSSPLTAYKIYRGYSSSEKTFLVDVAPSSLTYTDTTCEVGRVCYYQLTAVNAAGESPRSAEHSASPL